MSNIALVREATVRIIQMLAEKHVKVTQRGTTAKVEYDSKTGRPIRVNIPYLPDDANQQLILAVQGFIDHEVAHILFSDYKVINQAAALKVHGLHNMIEDSFIERKMALRFSGSGLNLRNVGEFYLEKHVDVQLKAHPEQAAGLLTMPAIRAWAGQSVFQDYMADKWHHLKKWTDALGDAVLDIPKCQNSTDCLEVALKFKAILDLPPEAPRPPDDADRPDDHKSEKKDPKKKKEPKEKEKGESEEGHEKSGKRGESEKDSETGGEDEDSASKGDGEDKSEQDGESDQPDGPAEDADDDVDGDDSQFMPGVPSDKASSGGPDDSDEPQDFSGEEASEEEAEAGDDNEDATGRGVPIGKSKPTLMEELEKMMGESADFDKAVADALTAAAKDGAGSSEYLIFTNEMDRIEPAPKGDDVQLARMQNAVDHMVGPLQKDLERAVAARSATRRSAGHRSGKLHSSSLAKLVAFNDSRVFARKHIATNKDVAVGLLVDCSGSMSGSGKIQTAAYAAYGLASVLDRMNIANEVLGFTTEYGGSGRSAIRRMLKETDAEISDFARIEALYIPIFKSFKEKMTSEHKKRFAAMPYADWLANNVDGESLQIAAKRLAQRKEARKILIVLSDGQPACDGDYHKLIDHLKQTVLDVEKAGIDVLGIGIQTDAVRKFYKKHLVINGVADLPTAVMGEMKRLLMTV